MSHGCHVAWDNRVAWVCGLVRSGQRDCTPTIRIGLVCLGLCAFVVAGAEAERKLEAYRDYLYHLDQAACPLPQCAALCRTLH